MVVADAAADDEPLLPRVDGVARIGRFKNEFVDGIVEILVAVDGFVVVVVAAV
jgi:hypothetical protein